jgi:hypothetical protein
VPVGTIVFDVALSDSYREMDPLLSYPVTSLATLEESRALLHFREKTAFALGSHNSVVQDFFHTLVLQISHSEPCIKHMVVAAASLHEGVCLPPSESGRAKTLFSKHYSQAVALLTQPNNPPSLDTILTACLLFISCENFQGSTVAGLSHVQSGLNLLKDWKSTRSLATMSIGSADWLIRSRIEPIFERLRDQTSKYRPSRTVKHSASSTDPDIMTCSPVVQYSFHDLFVARDKLLEIIQWTLHYTKSPQKKSYKARIQKELENWENAVTKYTQGLLLQDSLEGRTALALRVHHRLISILVETSFAASETVFDKFQVVFQRIFEDCDSIIKHRDSDLSGAYSEQAGRMTLFEYDFGMIPPLFSLACRCRDSGLRRRAIRLLRDLHRSEGLWDSCSAAQIAEGLVTEEEEGLAAIQSCQDVIEQSRIQGIRAQPASTQRSGIELSFSCPPYEFVDDTTIDWAPRSTRKLHSRLQWVRSSHYVRLASANAFLASHEHHPELGLSGFGKGCAWSLFV